MRNADLAAEHMETALQLAEVFFHYQHKTFRVSLDQLEGAAVDGLIDAAQGYDPARGVPFWGFAKCRVRGAMLDLVRQVFGRNRRSPRECLSLECVIDSGETDDEATRCDEALIALPVEPLMANGFKRVFNRAMLSLVPADRKVVRMVYFRDVPQSEVARKTGVTECRVSQRHKRALAVLRRELELRGVRKVSDVL